MPTRIYHKDHGYVITNDQAEIDMLLAKGGDIDKPKYNPTVEVKPVIPAFTRDLARAKPK